MRYQKGNGAREIEKALKILQEYETAKSQYEISEGERQRIQGRGAGWTEQKDKIANDVSYSCKIFTAFSISWGPFPF